MFQDIIKTNPLPIHRNGGVQLRLNYL